jgi:phosphatidylglycerophosphate synthase
MIDKVLRLPKDGLLTPVAARLLRSIHPTAITVAACGVGLVAAVAVWNGAYGIGLALWVVNRVLDGLDGTVARIHQKQSDLGGYLDILLDTLIYIAIPLALALNVNTTEGYLALSLLMGSFYLNTASWMYLAALQEKHRYDPDRQRHLTSISMTGGLIEGAETILFVSLFLLFPGAMVPLFIGMAVLVAATVVQRLVWTIRWL